MPGFLLNRIGWLLFGSGALTIVVGGWCYRSGAARHRELVGPRRQAVASPSAGRACARLGTDRKRRRCGRMTASSRRHAGNSSAEPRRAQHVALSA
jgi:hypothetical protein